LSLLARARKRVGEILNTHQPPTLDEEIKEKLSSIIDEFERRE